MINASANMPFPIAKGGQIMPVSEANAAEIRAPIGAKAGLPVAQNATAMIAVPNAVGRALPNAFAYPVQPKA